LRRIIKEEEEEEEEENIIQIKTSSVLYMDKAMPPAPVKL